MEGVKDNKELLLITTKVSNHTKAHTQMQQLAVSFNFCVASGESAKHRKGEYLTPPRCSQCTQANNVKRFVAELDKPCTRPAQCTNEKQQARALTRMQGYSNSLQQWERTVSRRTESRSAQRTLEGRERRRCLSHFTGFLECCSNGLT